ncbi:hypothetical protein KDE12_01865 [Campylobacter sp. faydin G-105]|uniref:hypothetical protein n=1 Tax=Campylobacter anatolicus TaxID=2829105 RepID=UPI001B954862|nr:hypothetical protein [Campylobacter anatolicus]MBR8461595.1 hypothetical protein [Campylobacter anatolicus]
MVTINLKANITQSDDSGFHISFLVTSLPFEVTLLRLKQIWRQISCYKYRK